MDTKKPEMKKNYTKPELTRQGTLKDLTAGGESPNGFG